MKTETIEAPAAAQSAAPTAPRSVRKQPVSTPSSELRLITPELAEAYLKQNLINRPFSESHVKMLAREMEQGRWKVNGDTIRFAGGVLIDGQHRLEAARRSGVSFPAFVVEGLERTVFDTIDTGRTRSAADTLALQGEQHAKRLAATLRFVSSVLNDQIGYNLKLTTTEVEEALKKYPKVRDSVAFCNREAKLLMPFPLMAGLHYVFARIDETLANAVVEQLISGTGSLKQIHQLRERLLQNSLKKSKFSPKYIAALTIKAWNALRTQKELKNLGWRSTGKNPEEFPVAS